MKKLNRVQSLAAQSSLCVCLLIACQLYEPFSEEEVFKGAYERNFIRTFGSIAPDQSWDFSNVSVSQNHDAAETRTWNESDYPSFVDANGWFLVDADFFSAITNNIKFTEKADQSFALEIGENDCFDIFPIYQTSREKSGIQWALQAFVEGRNILSYSEAGWPMGTNVQIFNGTRFVAINDNDCTSKGTRAKAITHYDNVSGSKEIMYLNLCVTDYKTPPSDYRRYAPKGTQQSSLTGQMRIVDIPRPAVIDSRLETMFIACEAANFDPNFPYTMVKGLRYQSLVLMLVGPRLPKVIYLDQQGSLPVIRQTLASKRYMIEDLGSSSDFDFNDIVVDVEQSVELPVVIKQEADLYSNKALRTTVTLGEAENSTTRAIVRHLCGTKPFQLTIGDRVFKTVTDPTDEAQTLAQLRGENLAEETYFEGSKTISGWDPNEMATITGWRPDENNISVKVWRNGTDSDTDGGWLVQFPIVGCVPFIMALPTTMGWNPEGTEFSAWKNFVPSMSDSSSITSSATTLP